MLKLLTTILAALLFVGFSITSYAATDKCREKCKNYAGNTTGKKYNACVGHYCK